MFLILLFKLKYLNQVKSHLNRVSKIDKEFAKKN